MEEAGGKEEEEDGRRQATFMNSITWQVGNIIYRSSYKRKTTEFPAI